MKNITSANQLMPADPVSAATGKIRRNLLFFSVIALVMLAYEPDSMSMPLTSLPATALLGAIGCVVLYFLIAFLIGFIADVRRWHASQRVVISKEHLDALVQLSSRMQEVDAELGRLAADLKNHEKLYKEELHKITKPIIHFIDNYDENEETQQIRDRLDKYIDELKYVSFPQHQVTEYQELKRAREGSHDQELASVAETITHLEDDSEKLQELSDKIRHASQRRELVQMLNIYVWQGTVPLGLALLCLVQVSSAMLIFVGKVV